VHIEDGDIGTVIRLDFTVKVPVGMSEPDLARPVIDAKDFQTGACLFEIYSYGEQIVVMPVKIAQNRKQTQKKKILHNIDKFVGVDYSLEQISSKRGILYVPEKAMGEIIGKNGRTIAEIEKEVGLRLDVQPLKKKIKVDLDFTRKSGKISMNRRYRNIPLSFYHGDEFIFSATVGKKGVIKLDMKSKLAKKLRAIWKKGEPIYALEE
jgi:ATPase